MKPKNFNIKDYTISDFEINPYYSEFYIVTRETGSISIYMHRDGTLHDFCGIKNFFPKDEAINILDKAFSKHVLDDKLFEI